MATKININGKIVSRPGVYALTRSGIRNPAVGLPYGGVCIIDDGIGAGWGGGAGSEGTATQGGDSIYRFNTIQAYRDFVKGGPLWDVGLPLFRPAGSGIPGASEVILIQARESAPATIVYSLTNGDFTVTTKDEGINANGVIVSSNLSQGYGMKIRAGILDPNKFIFTFYHGTFKGIDPLTNLPYDGIPAATARPLELLNSPEVANLQQLFDWMASSQDFKNGFVLTSQTIDTAPGVITAGDLSANAGFKAATGGTEDYTAAAFQTALKATKNLDYYFHIATKYGVDATDANNVAILDFIEEESRFEKSLWIGGGSNKAEFTSISIPAANSFNNDKVIIVHGAGLLTTRTGFEQVSQFYKTCAAVGRCAGLEPQTPLTFKRIAIDGEVHKLDEDEQELSLTEGVLTTYNDTDFGYHCILQGINSLQNNDFLVNDDGTSHSIQIRRITAQLNKEIIINAKRKFFGKDMVGPNRNTVGADDIAAWLEGFLQGKIADSTTDNLILRFANISVTIPEQAIDTFYASYEFVPNFEVNKIVFTGVLLSA